jgi:hypothetical protein
MPINPKQNESQDDFITRCIRIEIENGKSQPQAVAICIKKAEDEFKGATPSVSDATWSTAAPVSVNFESYSDYPESAKNAAKRVLDWAEKNGYGDCLTSVGKQRANQLAKGEPITEETISRMAAFARHLKNKDVPYSEGCGGMAVDAWGGQAGIEWAQNKLEKIRKEKLQKQDFRKVKKVLFEEEFDIEKVRSLKDMGFKVYVRSQRKIKKKDRKVWNKLKSAGLTEDNLIFGSQDELNKKMEFSFIDGQDCFITHLSRTGQVFSTDVKVLHSEGVKDILHAKEIDFNLRRQFEGKFRTVRITYEYKEIDDIPPAASGSRPFCTDMMLLKGREWTLEELISAENETLQLGMENLAEMDLPEDLILYRGGFYRNPKTGITTPFCRHEWKVNVRLV